MTRVNVFSKAIFIEFIILYKEVISTDQAEGARKGKVMALFYNCPYTVEPLLSSHPGEWPILAA